MALVVTSNDVYSGMLTARPAKAESNAKNLAAEALRSEPVASVSNPPTIGTQIARLRNGIGLPVISTVRSKHSIAAQKS
ncbi:hypothetical protein GCM10007933_13860 [Zoogloea oryzae]|uniref:Uncharacterized protein n=1 Tax=Zoogloea oryzae TaxID=310767 RepID=A0ABQ6FAV8_9RHOO|nr:hypothetical protein GCM10007933_13860 [Zoogloea oryzae]